MSQAKRLAEDTLKRIRERLQLHEHTGAGGGPYLPLTAVVGGQSVGALHIWRGPQLPALVYVGLTVPQFKLDSHMLFAFTASDSAVPHFTVDSVYTGEYFAFHLDLIPRVDLGANLDYIDRAFNPLTETWTAAQKLEGLSPAQLTPRQNALMSPWMLAYRATEGAFGHVRPFVDAYLAHGLTLVESRFTVEGDARALAERDRLNRDALFNPAVDPVWGRVDRLVGPETGLRMREILRGRGIA